MELLIVVAVIVVLVAIAIPVFSSQLEKSREAVDLANIRGAYAVVMTTVLTDEPETFNKTVELKQTVTGWKTPEAVNTLNNLVGEANITGIPKKNGKATVLWQNNVSHIVFEGPLPVDLSNVDTTDPVQMSEFYGKIVSYLFKNEDYPMEKLRSRYHFYGEGETDADKVKIFTAQTFDGKTREEIQQAMKTAGYSDSDSAKVYKNLSFAYLDKDGNLLGYHGPSSGGSVNLYIVGSDDNPINLGGSTAAANEIARRIQATNK